MTSEDRRTTISQVKQQEPQGIRAFLKDHRNTGIIIGTGVIGIGIGIWFLSRYLRKVKPEIDSKQLDEIEKEALSDIPDPVKVFETATELNRLSGGVVVSLAKEAAEGEPDPLASSFETISAAVAIEKRPNSSR